MPIIDPFDTPAPGGKAIVDPFDAPAPKALAPAAALPNDMGGDDFEQKLYARQRAGRPQFKGDEYSKPPEGGIGRQLLGVVEGMPVAPYAALAGLPGVNQVLPSGDRVLSAVLGKPSTPAEAAGRESGMMLGLGPLSGGVAPTLRAGEKMLQGAGELAPIFRTGKAVEKELAPATSVSAVGEKLESKIQSRLSQLTDARRKEFEGVKNAYFDAGRKSEAPILDDYTRNIQEFYAKNADRLSVDERNLLKKSLDRLADRPVSLTEREAGTVAPGFDAIEKERRFLDDVSKGLKVEGAEAIPAMFAKDMSKMLEASIQKHVPKEFEQFNTAYKTLSEPINRYNTALGQSVTKRADDYLPEFSKIDPAKIPDKFFSSKRSINELRELTGDEQFVQQAAREHIANELKGMKQAKEIRDYMRKNYDWLQELPGINKTLDTIADRVGGGDTIKNVLKYGFPTLLGFEAIKDVKNMIGQ